MDISIVIPNFNGKGLLEKNLPLLIKAKENKSNCIKEVIVVDDASSDSSVEFLRINYGSNVKLIVHRKNRGFASGVNTGARTATGELICLINTDVRVSKDFLEKVSEDFKDKKVFAVSLHEEGYGPAKGKFVDGFIVHEPIVEQNKILESFWASGGSAVFRRDTWMDLKGMDEKVMSPFYWEDIDLSYRAQKRGYTVLWDYRCKVVHEHESTMKKLNQGYVNRIRERNQLLFIWKNLTSRNLVNKHKQFLLKRILRHPKYLIIFLMAVLKLRDVRNTRKVEIKEAKLSDEAIFAKFN